jgi:hypothetical protein
VPRTPEEVKADETVREAVLGVLRAYGWDDTGVLTDWLVIGSLNHYGDDGVPVASLFALHGEESIPLYRLLGLCDAAATRYRSDMTDTEDEEGGRV